MSISLDLERARYNMVEQQVRTWDVLDYRVLDVLHQMPREDFVQSQHRNLAYADVALPAGEGEFLFKPVIDGRILQALALTGSEDILEIGSGSGYLTACLAKLGATVLGVERSESLCAAANLRLSKHAAHRANVVQADVYAKDFDPGHKFDVIVVAGAVLEYAHFKPWLKSSGRIFVVRGYSPVMEAILIQDQKITSLFETDIPYLRGAEPKKQFQL